MGCWQETCALSLTPIYEGEPCIMVIMDAEWTTRVRAHSSVLGSIGSNWQWRPFREFHRGTYNDYGWINELEDRDRRMPCLFSMPVYGTGRLLPKTHGCTSITWIVALNRLKMTWRSDA